MLGAAAGDALGAGYEFGPPLPEFADIAMIGGGPFNWEPGEWTDDTSMAIPIVQVISTGLDLRSESALDTIVASWFSWAGSAKDIGAQTSAVFNLAGLTARSHARTVPTAQEVVTAARRHHETFGRSGGNGSLMRTAPVALGYLHDEESLIEAATQISALTHHDPEAGEACALWCLAVRHAVLEGELDVRRGLANFASDRAAVWSTRLDEAERFPPSYFDRNGWVVQALQGAWSAIAGTRSLEGEEPAVRLTEALKNAVQGGRDTDTVAAIAGGLLGGMWGASAVPDGWRQILHGWPGLDASDLICLANSSASQ
jgi:ADP-ribosyl-[dinitrogen reductase] hydrolase